ncbi:MAG: LPS assembly lipoprotein LptE [Candidatus Binatia bacterium]
MRISEFEIRNWAVVIGIVSALVGVGCGYQFSGRGQGLPKDVQTVFVAPFVNRTRNVGLDREISSALRSEFHRRGDLRVVSRLEEADSILSGVVRFFETKVVAVNREDEVLQFETELVVDLSLRRRFPEELLWRTQGIRLVELHSGSRGAVVTTSSAFKTGTLNAEDVPRFTDVQLTVTLGRMAKGQLVEKFAREVHQRLVEMF